MSTVTFLPRLALAVRQPWAHALAMGWKPVENRSWRVLTPARKHVGAFCIHASKGMTREEYEHGRDFIDSMGFRCPPAAELLRGGIVGVARVIGIVSGKDANYSPWFFGPRGIVIADAQPVDFVAVGGRLDFFEWRPLLPVRGSEAPEPPARWMLKAANGLPEQGALL